MALVSPTDSLTVLNLYSVVQRRVTSTSNTAVIAPPGISTSLVLHRFYSDTEYGGSSSVSTRPLKLSNAGPAL